jgi:site-specific DNA recombinase
MKTYFAYIRVSTVRQGEQGSSLQEQRAAIEAFAARNELTIGRWFEEMETAAKSGRNAFNRMLADVDRGRAAGIIIHKIDRSARNLRDWARLGELLDKGVDVRFAHDNLDLTTRGGRLAADLQAVVAADFIRNLREEVRKGIYGRLKQGYLPRGAPVGYLNSGPAKPKLIDPVKGPLIQQAFELYGTGTYSLKLLCKEIARRGLRTAKGDPLPVSNVARILHNPFYIGLILVPATGELFQGNHEPLVTKRLFDRVQAILGGKCYARVEKHEFLFRRFITCKECGRSLTGERQKGNVYYRCHAYACRKTSIRESAVDQFLRAQLANLIVAERDVGDFRRAFHQKVEEEREKRSVRASDIDRDLALVEERLARITEAVIDGTIDKESYIERKAVLLSRKTDLLNARENSESPFWKDMAERFELGLTALEGYCLGTDSRKRQILAEVGSNLLVKHKEPVFPMFDPFSTLRDLSVSGSGGPDGGAVRTLMDRLTERSALRDSEIRNSLKTPYADAG